MALNIGIDIGGTNIRFGVFNGITLIDEVRIEANLSVMFNLLAPIQATHEIVQLLSSQLKLLLEQHNGIQGIGIGFPGFIHPQTKKIVQSPNMPGLSNFNLSKELSAILSLPVLLENDALAAAYGEYCLLKVIGGNPENESLIYVGLGTGVGGGLINAGKDRKSVV